MKKEDSDEVYKGVTDEKGEILFENLIPGKYILTEKKTKKEYNINEEPFDITVEGNRQTDITVENEKKKGNIKVIKKDSENGEIKLSRC